METGFAELNLYVYNSAVGAVYDVVIWCLRPMIDESKEYGFFRLCLAVLTCRICRRALGVAD